MGYSRAHKDYKCLSSTGKVYISKHVIFNENEFPFHNGFLNTKTLEHIVLAAHEQIFPLIITGGTESIKQVLVPCTSHTIFANNESWCGVQGLAKVQHEESTQQPTYQPIHSKRQLEVVLDIPEVNSEVPSCDTSPSNNSRR